MRIVALLSSVLLLFSLAGCLSKIPGIKEPIDGQRNIWEPSRGFMRGLPQDHSNYSQGLRDGCETFLGIMGAGPLRMLPEKLDGFRLSDDPIYARGFMDGGHYCTFTLDWDTH